MKYLTRDVSENLTSDMTCPWCRSWGPVTTRIPDWFWPLGQPLAWVWNGVKLGFHARRNHAEWQEFQMGDAVRQIEWYVENLPVREEYRGMEPEELVEVVLEKHIEEEHEGQHQ